MDKLREEFEAVYSLSIRRGEDSATVWEWFKKKYVKQLNKHVVSGSLPYKKEEWEEAKRIKRAHKKFMDEIYGQ